MSRYFLPLFLFSLFFTPLLHAQELTADEQKKLMAALQARRAEMPSMTAEFTEERTTRLLSKPIVSTGTVAFQAPNKFRRELKGNAPSLTACNGSDLWIYYPNFKQAEHYTLGQRQFFDDSIAALTAGLNFQDVDKYFRFTVEKEAAGHKVTLTPKSGSLKKILTSLTVWLDAEGDIQKSDAALPKGDRVVTTYRAVKATKVSDAKFDFAPPAGVEVTTPLGK